MRARNNDDTAASAAEPAPESGAGTVTALEERDRAVIAWQIGREPRACAGVAARCVFGFPAVTLQADEDAQGRPFPTAYYATCPHLVRQIDRLEGVGAVRRYERAVLHNVELAAALLDANSVHARTGRHRGRIAASGQDGLLKCLHAHAAFALAHPPYLLGMHVLAEAGPRWCDDAYCARAAGDSISAANSST